MLSLGCERLPTLKKKKKKKKKKKVLDHYLHHDLGMLLLLRCFFAHLLILQYPDHHQNLISSSLYYSGPIHKISSQSVHNFLSNVVHRQTNQRHQKHNLLCQGGNKTFRILMGMHHKARMSKNLTVRGLDPFKVIVWKLSWSFRRRALQSDNILLKTIVNSM